MLDYNMTRLGYYAKDSNNNLFQYEWGYDEVFYIMINGEKTIADPNKYEVLDLSYSQKNTRRADLADLEEYRLAEEDLKDELKEYYNKPKK